MTTASLTTPAASASDSDARLRLKQVKSLVRRSFLSRVRDVWSTGKKGRLGFSDLPRAVRQTLDPFLLAGRNQFDSANRLTEGKHILYHVGLRREDDSVDVHLLFGERGEILRRAEFADF